MTGTTTLPTVLVADDQPDVVAALRMLLKDAGIATEPATSTRDVIDRLGAKPYDLLLMDLNYERDTTSGDEGLELLSHVRAHDDLLPVVVMTGWSSIETAVEAMRRGARNYVRKPWNNAALVDVVRREIEAGWALRHDHDHAARETEQAQAVQRALLPEACRRSRPAISRPAGGPVELRRRLLRRAAARRIASGVLDRGCVRQGLAGGHPDVSSTGVGPGTRVAPGDAPGRRHGHQPRPLPPRRSAPVRDAFLCRLRHRPRGLRFCNAGHNPPILLRHHGSIERLATGGTVPGAFEEAVYETGEARLEPGDRLVLFTDGVTEACSPRGAEFGDDRLVAAVRQPVTLDPEGMLDRLFREVRRSAAGFRTTRRR